jgi:hypothetical protein
MRGYNRLHVLSEDSESLKEGQIGYTYCRRIGLDPYYDENLVQRIGLIDRDRLPADLNHPQICPTCAERYRATHVQTPSSSHPDH